MRLEALFILVLIFTIIPASAQLPWCEIQSIYFQHNETPDITGYETWINYPSGGTEIDENVSVKNTDGLKKIDTYISPPNEPRAYSILKGLRTYHTYHYVSTAVGNTKIRFQPFLRKANGTEVVLYNLDTADIDDLTTTEVITNYASTTDLKMEVTDRLGVNVYAFTDHSSPVVVHFVYQGYNHTSHVDSGYFDCVAPVTQEIPNLPATKPDIWHNPYFWVLVFGAGGLLFVRLVL